jgi:hypothetical protein
LVLIGDDARMEVSRRHLLLAPVGYAAALAMFLTIYYGTHAMLFKSPKVHSAANVADWPREPKGEP